MKSCFLGSRFLGRFKTMLPMEAMDSRTTNSYLLITDNNLNGLSPRTERPNTEANESRLISIYVEAKQARAQAQSPAKGLNAKLILKRSELCLASRSSSILKLHKLVKSQN